MSEEYLLVPGPSSHRDHLSGPVDFTVTPPRKSGPVATAIGWLLLPIILVLVAVLLVVILPLVLVIGGVVFLRRWFAERRLGRVAVVVSGPEVEPPRPGGARAAVVRAGARWRAPVARAVVPGERVRFSVRFQPETQVEVDRVSARLVGTEECRSGSGTNAKTHTHTLCDQTAELAQGFTCMPGVPMDLAGELTVPDLDAYSFRAHDNALKWKLEVIIEVPRWPDWKRDHPLALIPRPLPSG